MFLPLLRLMATTLMSTAIPATIMAQTVTAIMPTLETPNLAEENGDADADDPSFWISPSDPVQTRVITAAKNGGVKPGWSTWRCPGPGRPL